MLTKEVRNDGELPEDFGYNYTDMGKDGDLVSPDLRHSQFLRALVKVTSCVLLASSARVTALGEHQPVDRQFPDSALRGLLLELW